MTDTAKQGVFTYANGAQANLFNIFAAYNAANGTSFPASVSQINAMTAARFAEVDRLPAECRRPVASGVAADRSQPAPVGVAVPNDRTRTYYPTFRIDYNVSDRMAPELRVQPDASSDSPHANADHWPGDGRGAANHSNNVSAWRSDWKPSFVPT